MNPELVYALFGLAVTGIVLGLWAYGIVKTHRRERALSEMADEELTPEERALLRLTGDVDTHVIPQPKVDKAVGRVGGISPIFQRREIQPKRHRAFNTRRKSDQDLNRNSGVTT